MKRSNVLVLVMLLVISLFGCSPGKDATTKQSDNGGKVTGGELQVAYNAQPPTMDPLLTSAVATRDITRHIFESLVTFNQKFEVEPMLAESYEVSDDGKTITFQLRKGIKFHNGDEMTVEDVVSSMNRWKDTTPMGKAYFSKATFKESGENAVVLEMPERLSTALAMLADPGQSAVIVPKEVNEGATEKGLSEFIGTGPFQFKEWKTDQYIHLEKFEDYQSLEKESGGLAGKKEALVDDIYFQFITDASTRLAGIQTGEYDVANAIPFDNGEQLEANADVTIYVDHNGFNGIVFNKKQGLFKNVTARQAVNAALDLEEVLKASFTNENYYELEHGLMIKDQESWYSEAGKDQYNQNDKEKAKKILKDAGYNGEEIVMLTSRDYEDHYNAAVVVQQELEKIGMKVKLDVYDWPTLLEKREDPNAFDIFVTGFPTEQIPAKYSFLDSAKEWPGWSDSPEIDELLDQINRSASQEEAKKYFAQLQEEFYQYLPIIKFGNKTTITATRSNIEGMGFLQGIILWNVEKK
ncbi:peptide/nickel transport system substrate-binding protein [Bacillus thermophilus]|uniref:Peptide/nickel transport system substrate-binding protein n=1 Tax=Siminovitchia thermophila TaxID=1245522 RepID=A0ABS2R355_9BACI|nr:ABC transporter substrate-binding protein [Siminovitchia thermophila]MBM7714062.1 peptide/nickel transport system substrate-binding protein [Siminovitchia thermophila]